MSSPSSARSSYTVTDGATFQRQDNVEGSFTINVNKRKHVGMGFSTQGLTLSIDRFTERFITLMAQQLAQQVDSDLCGLYKYVWNYAGAPAISSTASPTSPRGRKTDLLGVPQADRFGILSPSDTLGDAWFADRAHISDAARDAYRDAELGSIGNVMTGMSQSVATHTVGTGTGTPR